MHTASPVLIGSDQKFRLGSAKAGITLAPHPALRGRPQSSKCL